MLIVYTRRSVVFPFHRRQPRIVCLLAACFALAIPITSAQAVYETEVQAECVGWSSPGYLSFSVPGYVTFGARMRETLHYRIGYLWRDPATGRRGRTYSSRWHTYQVLSKYAGHMEGDTMIIGGQAITGTSQVPFMRIPRRLWVHPMIQSWAPSTGYRISSWNPTARGAFARLSGPYCRVI